MSGTAQLFDNCRHCGHPSNIHHVHVGQGGALACNSMGCRCRAYEEPLTKLVRVLTVKTHFPLRHSTKANVASD